MGIVFTDVRKLAKSKPAWKVIGFLLLIIVVLMALAACEGSRIPSSETITFSFEGGMEGWAASATDLHSPFAEWSIERSEDIASDGKMAVMLYLRNTNDAGKIWMGHLFEGEPNRTYEAHVEYDVASADCGDTDLWMIATGVVSGANDRELIFAEDTRNNAKPEDGFVWLRKSYDFNVESNAEGMLYALVGIQGTPETARTYYVVPPEKVEYSRA
ncbi:hypothetical protein ACFLVE_02305 [Chloroflexota bacterium]